MIFLTETNNPPTPEYCIHQYLWSYFDRMPDGARPFVFKKLKDKILMLSNIKPNCISHNISSRFNTGFAYQFDVLASPIRGTYRDDEGNRKRRLPYSTNADRIDWLKRRLIGCAEVRFAQVFDKPPRRFKKSDGHVIKIDECTIKGVVVISDKDEFINRIAAGIGGRGVWGCGLFFMPEIMQWNS